MTREETEERAVFALATTGGPTGLGFGFGRIMQICETQWRAFLIKQGYPTGSELTLGPCAAMLVPCQCVVDDEPDCAWCCGTGRVTERVRNAQLEAQARSFS